MSFLLDTESTGGDFQPVPPGIHLAICIYIADLGTPAGSFGPKPRLLFVFEVPGLLAPDGRPMTISRRFGKNLAEKGHLRPFLTSWLGAPLAPGQLDIAALVGRPAMLVVSQSQTGEKVYANITAGAPVQPGMPVPPPSVMPLCYGPGRDPGVFAALPEWIRKAVIAGGAAPAGMTAPVMAPAYPTPVYQAPAVQPAIVQPQMTTAQPITPEAPFNDALTF